MTTTDYRFDPCLARASTLPSRYYLDPARLGEENEKVFARTWQLVGHQSQLARAGDFLTSTIANEPVLVSRGRDGVLRAMSNVCRHRAGPVATGCGNRSAFQCGYHGWTWSLEGRLLGTPEFDGVENFDRSSVELPPFRVETWHGLVFANLDPGAPSLTEVLGEIVPTLGNRDLSRFRPAARKVWELECNWKVYVDNYLEGYHIPIVHPSLFREIDYPAYRTETRRFHSIQHAPLRKRFPSPRRDLESGEAAIRGEGSGVRGRPSDPAGEIHYFWVFPNLMLNVYADNFSTNLIVPDGPGRTRTLFEWFFEAPESAVTSAAIEQTIAFSDEIQLEDIRICEAVQRGLASRTYDAGRYSVARENGVHHFHGLLAEYLGPPSG